MRVGQLKSGQFEWLCSRATGIPDRYRGQTTGYRIEQIILTQK